MNLTRAHDSCYGMQIADLNIPVSSCPSHVEASSCLAGEAVETELMSWLGTSVGASGTAHGASINAPSYRCFAQHAPSATTMYSPAGPATPGAAALAATVAAQNGLLTSALPPSPPAASSATTTVTVAPAAAAEHTLAAGDYDWLDDLSDILSPDMCASLLTDCPINDDLFSGAFPDVTNILNAPITPAHDLELASVPAAAAPPAASPCGNAANVMAHAAPVQLAPLAAARAPGAAPAVLTSPFMRPDAIIEEMPWEKMVSLKDLRAPSIDPRQQHQSQQPGPASRMQLQHSGTSCTLSCVFDDVLEGFVVNNGCEGSPCHNSTSNKSSSTGTRSRSKSSTPTSIRMVSTFGLLTAPPADAPVQGGTMQQHQPHYQQQPQQHCQLQQQRPVRQQPPPSLESTFECTYGSTANSLLGMPLLKPQQPIGRFAQSSTRRSNVAQRNCNQHLAPATWTGMGGWSQQQQEDEYRSEGDMWRPRAAPPSFAATHVQQQHRPRGSPASYAGQKRRVAAGRSGAMGPPCTWGPMQRKRGKTLASDFDWSN